MKRELGPWLCLLLVPPFAGCGDPAPRATYPAAVAPAPLGPAGGRVAGPNGAEVLVPPGALSSDVEIAIGLPPVGTRPALPAAMAPVGATYALTPRELAFNTPARVGIPFDLAQVPRGVRPLLLSTTGGVESEWNELADAVPSGNVMKATTPGAAAFVVVVRLEILH